VGWRFDSEAKVLDQAAQSAAVSHDHPEGIRGAQAVALAVFLARMGKTKAEIARRLTEVTGYNLTRRLATVRKPYTFQVRCDTSVPEALIAFLESRNFDDAVKGAISLGGDADTQACIAGSVAEAFYGGVPDETVRFVLSRTHPWLLELSLPFLDAYGLPGSAAQVRGRWSQVEAALNPTPAYTIERLPDLPDAAEVTFLGPSLAKEAENLTASLGAVVTAGWTRLHFNLGAVTALSAADRDVLELVRQSCRVRWGLLAVTGASETLPAFERFAGRREALAALDASRGKGRMDLGPEGEA
jgi:hypothetical protein